MAEPDSALIQQAQRGDRAAMSELVISQQRYVYSIAMTLMRSPADAADLTQDAFIRLMRALPSYRAETKFTTWLYRLVVNLGLDELRRRARRIDPMTLDDDGAPDPPDQSLGSDPLYQATTAEDAERIRRAVQMLPVSQRLALTFYYFDEMTYEEIASVMDVPLNTVKSHIHRAKSKLVVMLNPSEPDSAGTSESVTGATRRDFDPGRANLRFSFLGAAGR
ncbi:MAG: sigma-70 family RNA polymerase sigma factor [Chloroflexota bacterium]